MTTEKNSTLRQITISKKWDSRGFLSSILSERHKDHISFGLMHMLMAATESVQIAMYHFRLERFATLLNDLLEDRAILLRGSTEGTVSKTFCMQVLLHDDAESIKVLTKTLTHRSPYTKVQIRSLSGKNYCSMHAKIVLVDGKLCMHGSANLTHTGLHKSYEVMHASNDSTLCSQLGTAFNLMWEKSQVITQAE